MNSKFVYIHLPFCETKCPFCSFPVAVSQGHRVDEYLHALGLEARSCRRGSIESLYIGGGTPSFLNVLQIEKMFRIVEKCFDLSVVKEITFECNPESVDKKKSDCLKYLGVNRISLGVQSMQDRVLSFLGRSHNSDDSRRAFDILRSVGFSQINLDLIYGWEGQTLDDLELDLTAILDFQSEHVSLYTLTIEEHSLFFAKKKKSQRDDMSFDEHIWTRLEEKGLYQYEISNFSQPGFESIHNMNYWQGGEYLGLGMAAHSHMGGKRFWNANKLSQYLRLMKERGSAIVGEECLPVSQKIMEGLLFGLRMNKGVDLCALQKRFSYELSLDKVEAIESFMEMGLLEEDGTFLRTTNKGRLVLDEISARLI